MSSIREKLVNMFTKIMAGTVTREEGAMLINHLAKEDQAETIKELSTLIDNPPPNMFPKTILHTIALSRNKAFLGIMTESLEHENEEVSILGAQELARLRTTEARNILLEHLNNEVYHVRKASAAALAESFAEGIDILKKHIMEHPEPFYRATSAQALLKSRKGIEALLLILNTGNPGAIASAAEALSAGAEHLEAGDAPKVFDSLMLAGDRKDGQSIIELLKVVAAMRGMARGFEKYVMVFSDYPSEPVRKEVENALKQIR